MFAGGTGTVAGNLLVSGGMAGITPGFPFTVTGSYTQTAGTTSLFNGGTLTVGGLPDLEGGNPLRLGPHQGGRPERRLDQPGPRHGHRGTPHQPGYDLLLVVTGFTALDGTLVVTLVNGFQPLSENATPPGKRNRSRS
jgi:hypothetical protein